MKQVMRWVVIGALGLIAPGCSSQVEVNGQAGPDQPGDPMDGDGSGGEVCTVDMQCAGGVCEEGRCVSQAAGPACGRLHCAQGRICVEGQCAEACAPQQPRCRVGGGWVCCAQGQACLFDQCVAVGMECEPGGCADDEVCEPTVGRCVSLSDVQDGSTCRYRPPTGDFRPVEQFHWEAPGSYGQLMMTPMVANLTDDDGDGEVSSRDIPDIVFHAYQGSNFRGASPIYVISGDDGRLHWRSDELAEPLHAVGSSHIALADVDNDGQVEILAELSGRSGLGVISATGQLEAVLEGARGAPSVTQLDGGGLPEIVTETQVVRADGEVVCGASGGFRLGSAPPVSFDLEGDGNVEIASAVAVYTHDASLPMGRRCRRRAELDPPPGATQFGWADFDDDGRPEAIYLVAPGANPNETELVMVDTDGGELWRAELPRYAGCRTYCAPEGGPFTIADYDGDGQPEFGLAVRHYYVVYDGDGELLWAQRIEDDSSAMVIGSSVFDFEGDGVAEVVFADGYALHVFSGPGKGVDEDGDGYPDGVSLAREPTSSWTLSEYPVIADVDNDNSAEIVLAASHSPHVQPRDASGPPGFRGVRVFGDAQNNWVRTRRIWNQHAYYVTHVDERGQVPANPRNNWEVAGLDNLRQNVQGLGGEDLSLAPNFTVEGLETSKTNCAAGVTVRYTLRNTGSVGGARRGRDCGGLRAPRLGQLGGHRADPQRAGAAAGGLRAGRVGLGAGLGLGQRAQPGAGAPARGRR